MRFREEDIQEHIVTGSIGIDTVETPFGKRDDVIGGSAIYFAYAASFLISGLSCLMFSWHTMQSVTLGNVAMVDLSAFW